jgi:hypothetical protein
VAEAALTLAQCLQSTRDMAGLAVAQYDEATTNCAAYTSAAGLYAADAGRPAGEPAVYLFENAAIPRI